jgi:ATP-binding cassette subfamily B protein
MKPSPASKRHTKDTLRIYAEHSRKHLLSVILTFGSIIAASIFGNIPALYYKKILDLLSQNTPSPGVASKAILLLIAIAAIELVRWFFFRTTNFAHNHFQARVTKDLYQSCFERLHRHSFSFFNNAYLGALIKRVNRFVSSFEVIADNIIWSVLPIIVNTIMIVYILSSRAVWLGLIMCVWIVLFLTVNIVFTRWKLKFDIAANDAETASSGHLADTIGNHGTVKLFNGFSREYNHFQKLLETARVLRLKSWNADAVFEGAQGALAVILEIGIFYGAIQLWTQGLITVGDFVLIQAYILTILLEVWGFGRLLRRVFENLANANDMTETLVMPYEIQDIPQAKNLSTTQGKIVFNHVSFSYRPLVKQSERDMEKTEGDDETTTAELDHDQSTLFKDLTFTIQPKQKIALVGPSGSGKSTIIKLLLRMHDLTDGAILIDDQPVNQVTQESLWAAMSLVPQDPVLFHRSVKENIRYGKPEASDEEIIEAAKRAHCHEFIERLEKGYETEVGERGVKLSGGERQRIAIARAILRNAPILLLDEATSSLDSESEKLIQDALHTLMKNKTVIVVAHRLSTIMEMDRIIVLKNGQIIEDDSHQALIKQGGLYAGLWKLQAGGFIKEE